MLIQVDSSHHPWLGDQAPPFTLLIAVDDATGTVVDALFCEQEDSRNYFFLIQGLIQRRGIPVALYTGRHAVFRHTPGPGLLGMPTQFGRAMEELGVRMIFARSPQAKGRVERTAGTFQDRLVTELRLAGAGNIEEANRALEQLLSRFNRRFRVPPQHPEPAFRPLDPELCFKHNRRVARDNTVRFQLHTLQLLPGPERPSYAGAAVEVLEGLDRRLSVRHEGASSLPRRRPPVRYSSGTDTGVPRPFLSRPPAPTAWANAGPRPSNHWTPGSRTRRIKGKTITARPPPEIPKPPLRASRHSFKGRCGRGSRKPGARGCRFERLSGNWGSTGAPTRNT